MGPIIIFDKSTLECLNPDEAVWLDQFFNSNITPLFYIETLADLAIATYLATVWLRRKRVSEVAESATNP